MQSSVIFSRFLPSCQGQLGLPLASRGPRSKHRGLSRGCCRCKGSLKELAYSTCSIGIEPCTSSRFISFHSNSFWTFYSFETCCLWQEPRVEPQRSQSVEEPPLVPMITAAWQISKCCDVFCNFPAFL